MLCRTDKFLLAGEGAGELPLPKPFFSESLL